MFDSSTPQEYNNSPKTPRLEVVELDERRATQFLIEQILNVNLQNRGGTLRDAPDFRFTSNQEFWNKVLLGQRLGLRWVELVGFQIVDWFPRTPGLYHMPDSEHVRHKAKKHARVENGITFYSPMGKLHMMDGGIGSIRFKPITLENEEFWLYTATSDSYCHSGIPLAIPNQIIQGIDTNFANWFKISGQVKFLPKSLEDFFRHMKRIPQLYIIVDKIGLLNKDTAMSPVKITPMVFFCGDRFRFESSSTRRSYRDFSMEEYAEIYFGPERVEGGNVTYVTCRSDSVVELDSAAEWMEWYADKYQGKIITNFDQQRPTFQDAPFSLQNVMSGNLDTGQIKELNFTVHDATIITSTIQDLYSEATTMTQISVTLGDGVTIHGDFAVAGSIKESFNKASSSNAPDDFKDLLQKLTTAVGKMTEQMPKETAQQVARDLDTLVAEATSPAPRQQWWQLSIEGLKKAAQDVGEIGKPVLELAGLIVSSLMGGSV